MDDYEYLSMNPKDQSSFNTQSTSFPVSMQVNSSIEKYIKESVMLALKYKNEYTIFDKKSNTVKNLFSFLSRGILPEYQD